MDDCVFCKIIDGRAPAFILDENEHVIVFLSLESHPLIVPKRHIADIHALDDDLGAAIMQASIGIAKAVRQGLNCDGIYVTQANGAAAGQDVFHYHMHIYPRWHDQRQWASYARDRERTAGKIKAAL